MDSSRSSWSPPAREWRGARLPSHSPPSRRALGRTSQAEARFPCAASPRGRGCPRPLPPVSKAWSRSRPKTPRHGRRTPSVRELHLDEGGAPTLARLCALPTRRLCPLTRPSTPVAFPHWVMIHRTLLLVRRPHRTRPALLTARNNAPSVRAALSAQARNRAVVGSPRNCTTPLPS